MNSVNKFIIPDGQWGGSGSNSNSVGGGENNANLADAMRSAAQVKSDQAARQTANHAPAVEMASEPTPTAPGSGLPVQNFGNKGTGAYKR